VGAAAEAVIELLGRAYREGRRFLGMERAAGSEVSARFLERYLPIDYLDDVDPSKQSLDKVAWNHGLG
jgi:hypothetical protein